MNPKKSFDMYQILNAPTLIFTCTTVKGFNKKVAYLKTCCARASAPPRLLVSQGVKLLA